MSSYNYNVQISLAGSNSVSREQEKVKNTTKKHQEHADVIMRRNAEAHNKVSAVPDEDMSYQVHNEKEYSKSDKSFTKDRGTKIQKRKDDDVLSDDKKGTKINVVC